MDDNQDADLGDLLAAVERKEPGAFDRLVATVYPELKRLAHFQMAKERPGHTLNTTAIVHEAFVRMAGGDRSWNDRGHFLRATSKVMRHLLVDHARKKNAGKRGAGAAALTLEEGRINGADDSLAVLALENALDGMKDIDPRLESIVECRFYAGLTVNETAEALGMSVRSVEREWTRARGYLFSAMDPQVE